MNQSNKSFSKENKKRNSMVFRFNEAKAKVKERYTAIEDELLLEFSRAQVRNDKKAMKKYIKLLSKFKVNSTINKSFF
jgi:hypothetical protein